MLDFKNLLELNQLIPDEDAAVAHFTALRWKNGEYCVLCGAVESLIHFADKRRHRCTQCNGRFTIRIGTIFEDSRLPLRTWMLAIWYISSHKKGIASTQLAKDLGVTQKTAWFMMHRLRHAARTRSFNRPLGGAGGSVEIDETFVGGKAKNKHKDVRGTLMKSGQGKKAIVIGAVERQGSVIAETIPNTKTGTVEDFVRRTVSVNSGLVATDSASGYQHLHRSFRHEKVDHMAGEYVRGETHTNTIEGFWSGLKRQIYGIHHFVSAKHLNRYVDESAWRYNHRATEDAPRFNDFLMNTAGRLTYAALIA